MPDLSYTAAHQFWHDYNDKTIYRVIAQMEGIEDWTYDGNETLESAIQELGKQLDHIGSVELGLEEQFISLCANIKTSRSLRLLQCLDTANPGTASKLLVYAEEKGVDQKIPALFLRRNVVFERLRLLTRVFSPERFNLVMRAMEGEDE